MLLLYEGTWRYFLKTLLWLSPLFITFPSGGRGSIVKGNGTVKLRSDSYVTEKLQLSNYFSLDSFTPPVIITMKDPSYLILAPRLVRAGQKYKLVVNILPPAPALIVRATLFRDNIQLDFSERFCENYEPQILAIQVPSSSSFGNYRLKLEGNEVGWLTGTAFNDGATLEFSPKGATIAIQLDKPIYKQGSKVKMRVIALDLSARLVDDSVDVFVLSPKGVLIKRWLSRQCLEGAIGLEFSLSASAEEGKWTIRAEAANSFAEKQFVLENYQESKFEVRVHIPSFLAIDEEFLRGTVFANYSSGAPVTGNISVRAALKPFDSAAFPVYPQEEDLLLERNLFTGVYRFKFRLSNFDYFLTTNDGGEVLITASVDDTLWEVSHTGFAVTRIFNPTINLKFLGDPLQILRPPMPFNFYITASLPDGSHVSSSRLARHRLLVTPEIHFKGGTSRRLFPRSVKMTHDQYGLWDDEIDLHSELGQEDNIDDVVSMKLEAELRDSMGSRAYASMMVVTLHSEERRYIQVTTSSKRPKVGEYAIFHVRSNFYLEKFRYILLSKGMLIHADQESMEASLKSFPLVLTSQMAGMSTIVVYALERGKKLVVDALTFPVEALASKDLSIHLEELPSRNRLKVTVKGEPGSRVSLTGTLWDIYQMQAGNHLSQTEILDQMSFDSSGSLEGRLFSGVPLQELWISHNGLPEEVLRLPRSSFGADVNQTFSLANLHIMSDGEIPFRPTPCRISRGFMPCLLGGCYTSSSRCDRKWDCIDRSDEQNCPDRPSVAQKDLLSYRMGRQSRLLNHFANHWLWTDVVLGKDGIGSISVTAPERTSKLVLSAFGICPDNRISFPKEPVLISTTPSYWLHVEAPKRVGIWEQLGIRVTIVNQLNEELPATLDLGDSPSYTFVALKDFEEAQPQPHFRNRHPNAIKRSVSPPVDERHHSVIIPGQEARSLYLPIEPVASGKIVVTVEASFPGLKTVKSISIFVEPMGARQERHTSFLLDLNNRAYLFTFLDLQVPLNSPLQEPKAHLALFGDIVGGVSGNPLVTSEGALGLPQMGSETAAFSFFMSLQELKRWSKLEQEPSRDAKEALTHLALEYQSLLSYQSDDGGFMFHRTSSSGCVWMTSLILRCLHDISTNWNHLLFVDPQVTDKALKFVLNQQAGHGAFWEPTGMVGIRNLESSSNFALSQMNTRGLNISSTALTLIHLQTLRGLPEPLDSKLEKALWRGKGWLEDNLDLVAEASKPFEVALVALALHLLRSERREAAFALLARNARHEDEQYVYWGEDLVPLPSYRVEDNRPYLEPREFRTHDSGNVAATACALMVYASRREVMTPAIVRWLQSQRMHDGGWMSTFDTLLAWEALNLYSNIENKAKTTRMTITAEPMVPLSKSRVFYVTPTNLMTLQEHQLGEKLGSITVQGKGKGYAVLQLHLEYYITDRRQLIHPPRKSFILATSAISNGRNASTLSFQSCVTWIPTAGSETSGITVLQLTLPTGYGIHAKKLEEYVKSRKVPALRAATFRPRLITFFFDKIGPSDTCVEVAIDRWYPVANLTRIIPVKVFEFYSPESFEVELVDMSSITLDICEVCGSYQCTNCPVLSYYSSSASRTQTFLMLLNFYPNFGSIGLIIVNFMILNLIGIR